MKNVSMIGLLAASVSIAGAASAQVTKTVPGEMKTSVLIVEAIDAQSRQVTAKREDGTYDVFYVPTDVKRFDELKVGDKVNARYYENIVLQVKGPDEPSVATSTRAVTPAETGTGGTIAHQRTITAAITAIDNDAPSITFTGPGGWKYTTRVKDKEALAKVKVGDRVDITWTEARIVSIEPPK